MDLTDRLDNLRIGELCIALLCCCIVFNKTLICGNVLKHFASCSYVMAWEAVVLVVISSTECVHVEKYFECMYRNHRGNYSCVNGWISAIMCLEKLSFYTN